MKTERIIELLRAAEGISDYRINQKKTESSEAFFVKGKLETLRATDTTDTQVTVFVRTGEFLGDATFSLYSADTDADMRDKIESARRSAALVKNKSYELPASEQLVVDNGTYDDPVRVAEEIAREIFSLDLSGGLSLNALEVFLYRDTVRVINSRGIDKTEHKCRAMVEAIPTFSENGESVELYECYNFTKYDRQQLREQITKRLCEVRDRFHARAPKEKIAAPIVFGTEELSSLFWELAGELSFASIYNKQNAFNIGDAVVKGEGGDALTLTVCGVMDGGVRSCAFDSDGTTTRDVTVIENGVAKAGYGTVRFASYLGEMPTGQLSCIRAAVGTLTDEELCATPYLRVASMSGLQLDVYNDYIGGEVRLAYYVDATGEKPVTGISLSGKLSEALASMRLSKKGRLAQGYEGPVLGRFCGIEIV